MKRFSIFVLVLSMFSLTLYAHDNKKHTKLPLSESLLLLKNIQDKAIHLGSGPVDVHVFVDPLCPHSRNFMEMIVESDKMRLKYSYYFYLYTLPRLHSEKMVKTIYHAQNPLKLMIDVMVKKSSVKLFEDKDEGVDLKIKAISKIAQKLDVYKRPYMVMVKKPKIKRGNP